VAVTLTGTELAGSSAVIMSGRGVTCTVTGTPSSTTVNASCVIARNADLGSHTVRVTTTSGNIGSLTFQVTAATLGFSAPSPALNGGGTTTKNGTVTVSNTASGTTAGPFTFTAPPSVVKNSGPGTFSVVAGGSCTGATVLAPGASCTVNVRYAPGGSALPASGAVRVAGTGTTTATVTGPNFPAN
jgi:hypothetical protein